MVVSTVKTFIEYKTIKFLQEFLQNVRFVPQAEARVLQVVCCGYLATKVVPLQDSMAHLSGELAGTGPWCAHSFVVDPWMEQISKTDKSMQSKLQILDKQNRGNMKHISK